MSRLIRGPQACIPFEEERQRWSQARLSELNAELIVLNRSVSRLPDGQMVSVAKVYHGLKALALLAALILALLLGSPLLAGSGSPDAASDISATTGS